MQVTIISGTSRANNNTLRVAKALEQLIAKEGETIAEVIDFCEYDIPFYNGGAISAESLTPFQQQLVDSMTVSKTIIILTPEYNWFPTAELVNFIHRFADTPFASIWNKKVFAFVGISSGRGGRMPTVQLGYVVDKIISVFGFESITSPKAMEVQFVKQVLDTAGNSLGNAEFDKGLKQFVDYTLNLSYKM